MSKVTVYRVRSYDMQMDGYIQSRRWATRAGADVMGAEVIENTAREIDAADLEPSMQWTAIGYNPDAVKGFQTQVRFK